METTVVISLFSLLVGTSSLLVALNNARIAKAAKAESSAAKTQTELVAAIARKNEILTEYFEVLNGITENRFYVEKLSRVLAEMKVDDPEEHSRQQGNVRESLEDLNAEEERTKKSIDMVRAFDPRAIASDPKAQALLQELHGRPRELKTKLAAMNEGLKRAQPLLEKAVSSGSSPV